jgi:hypothetical protein
MVDVKKVTAAIRKPYLYISETASVTELINFNPANNPPNPGENVSTVYTIDPFAIFTQEDNKLKVKIPFTRFYRIKYVINPIELNKTQVPISPLDATKTHLALTESLVLRRVTEGSAPNGDAIKSGIYNQNGSSFLVFDPNSVSPNPTFTVRTCFTAGIVEGIVELYAGDVLLFEHTRTMFKRSYVGVFSADFYANVGDPNNPSVGSYTERFIGPMYMTGVNGCTIYPDDFIATSSFFFEISEITDL